MSLVTTARLYFGHSFRLSRSTSAVFPDPTGPATPTRNALFDPSWDISSPSALLAHPHRSALCDAVYQLALENYCETLSRIPPQFEWQAVLTVGKTPPCCGCVWDRRTITVEIVAPSV